MTRTRGARDLKRRKKRSDNGKRRKLYNGKKTKIKKKVNGHFIPYKSKRGKNDPIKIWFQEKKPMSKQGYYKWHKGLRKYVDRTIKRWVDRPVLINPNEISNPEKIENVAIRVLQYPGLFNLTMPSHSKSRSGSSYKKKAVIKITETDEGLHAKVSNYSQMRHYWFFKS